MKQTMLQFGVESSRRRRALSLVMGLIGAALMALPTWAQAPVAVSDLKVRADPHSTGLILTWSAVGSLSGFRVRQWRARASRGTAVQEFWVDGPAREWSSGPLEPAQLYAFQVIPFDLEGSPGVASPTVSEMTTSGLVVIWGPPAHFQFGTPERPMRLPSRGTRRGTRHLGIANLRNLGPDPISVTILVEKPWSVAWGYGGVEQQGFSLAQGASADLSLWFRPEGPGAAASDLVITGTPVGPSPHAQSSRWIADPRLTAVVVR